jgi:hypothetical protein
MQGDCSLNIEANDNLIDEGIERVGNQPRVRDINDMLCDRGVGFVRLKLDEALGGQAAPAPVQETLVTQGLSGKDQDWPEPDFGILDDQRGNLPAFPVAVLSPEWQDWLLRSAHGAGVTADHVMVPLLAVASSLIGTARRIKASRSYSQPFTLWTAVVGRSGSGKTPGMNVIMRPLGQIERDRRQGIAELQRLHETKVQTAKVIESTWKDAVKEAIETGTTVPPKPEGATEPGQFVVPRLYVSDVTIERLAVLLQSRPSGMLLAADELAALFLNMSRYSGGQDDEFWLQAWNGGLYVVERGGRPPVLIDHLLVGVTGGFQPDKLSESLEGAHDGMYARICFGWPAQPGYRPLTDDSDEIEPEIVNALGRLVKLPESDEDVFVPRDVWLSQSAREEFEQFRQFLHSGRERLAGREYEWWAKGEAHVLRLAGTLAYLDWSLRGGDEPAVIDEEFMKSAVLVWTEYFAPHSLAAVRYIGISEQHTDERQVLQWIKANDKTEVSVKDIRRDALSGRLNAAGTKRLLVHLASLDWLREVTVKPSGPGRPANRWLVNPKLLGDGPANNAQIAEIRPDDALQTVSETHIQCAA